MDKIVILLETWRPFGPIAVIIYLPEFKLRFNLAIPDAFDLRSYITPLMLNVTLALAKGLPWPSKTVR